MRYTLPFPLWKKYKDHLPGGQINHPLENSIIFRSTHQLPRLRLVPLKVFLSWHGALEGPSAHLVGCFQNYRKTWTRSGDTLCAKVPCKHQEQLTPTLIVHLMKRNLCSFPKKLGWGVWRPPLHVITPLSKCVISEQLQVTQAGPVG